MAPKTKPTQADSAVAEGDGLDFTENEGRLSEPETGKTKKEKKPKKPKKPKREKGEGGGIGRLLAVLFGLILVAGVSAALFFNLFGVRSNVVVPLIEKIPIVNNLVKPRDTGSGDTDASVGRDQLIAQIGELQAQNNQLIADNQSLTDRNQLYAEEVSRLQEFEASQARFRQEKEEFDRLIALNDPAAYAAFYESVSPENAQQLYQEAVTSVSQSKEFKKYITTVSSIDAAEAASILDEMTRTDMNLVVLILNNLDSETSGEILANMTTRNAVSAMRRMVPQQQ